MNPAWLTALVVVAAAIDPPVRVTGSVRIHDVRAGDTLTSLSARAGVEVRTLARDNGLSVDARLTPGARVLVDNRHVAPDGFTDGIVLNVPQRMLFVFKEGIPIRAFPVAVGRPNWRTPIGADAVAFKELDPVWTYLRPSNARWRAAAARSSPRCRPVRRTLSADTGSVSPCRAWEFTAPTSRPASTGSPRTAASGCIPMMWPTCSNS